MPMGVRGKSSPCHQLGGFMSFKGCDSNLSPSFCIDTPAQTMEMGVNEISWERRHRFRILVRSVTHKAAVMFSNTEF